MVVVAGVDAGTESYQVYAIDDGKECFSHTIKTSKVKEDPEEVFEALQKSKAEIVAGLSGYGLPVKHFAELTDEDISLMTLSKESEAAVGLRYLIETARYRMTNILTIPGIIHLPTVPQWRKINKIDMGTPDKLCSVALALNQLHRDKIDYDQQNFVLVEAGSGFNAFIAVEGGKVVDGIGGTSGFPAYSSLGSLDSELAYLLSPFPKSMIFKGGLKNYLGTEKPENLPYEVMEWLAEFMFKGIRAVETSMKHKATVVTSGRFFSIPQFRKIFEEFAQEYKVNVLELEGGKQSARGAAIIADGLAHGQFEKLVEHLEIKKARGTFLDYITPQVKKYLDFP